MRTSLLRTWRGFLANTSRRIVAQCLYSPHRLPRLNMAAIRAEATRGPTEATIRDAMTPMNEAPVVPVLLLGDSGVGKSTFIA